MPDVCSLPVSQHEPIKGTDHTSTRAGNPWKRSSCEILTSALANPRQHPDCAADPRVGSTI